MWEGTCHLFNRCIWSPMGAQEQGPNGQNFQNIIFSRCRSSAAKSQCVQMHFRSRITVVHAWECLRWPHLLARGGGGGWWLGMDWFRRKYSHFIFFRMHGRSLTELAMAGRILYRARGFRVISTDVYLALMVAQWVVPTRAHDICNCQT